jgi:hypothetical protein
VEVLGDGQGGAGVLAAVDQEGGDLDVGRTSRRSSAEARAMARKPAGWNPSMLAPKASTASRGVASENIVRSRVPTNDTPAMCGRPRPSRSTKPARQSA